jgi:hypothetical protein
VPDEVIDECFNINTTLVVSKDGGQRVQWYCELNNCCKKLRAGTRKKQNKTKQK